MKITVQVVLSEGDGTETVVREAVTLHRDALTAENLGLQLDEAKELLTAVQDTMVTHQVATALTAQVGCPGCGTPRRHKDSRPIVMRTLFGTLRLDSPRWWHCSCTPRPTRTFSPLAATLPERTTPELSYLQAKFAGLVSYGLSAEMLGEILPLGRTLHPPPCAARCWRWRSEWRTTSATSNRFSSSAAPPSGPSCPARTCPWSSAWTAATCTPAPSGPAATAGSR